MPDAEQRYMQAFVRLAAAVKVSCDPVQLAGATAEQRLEWLSEFARLMVAKVMAESAANDG